MRVFAAVAIALYATHAAAQVPASKSEVLADALRALPHHVGGLINSALPARTRTLRHYAIANVTVGGAEARVSDSVQNFYSSQLGVDLSAAYVEANRAPVRLDAQRIADAPVLDLDEFATGGRSYDWQRLNARYPDVKGIIRISQPATVSTYALVSIEIISPAGLEWLNVQELQRQPDGSWRPTRATAGGAR